MTANFNFFFFLFSYQKCFFFFHFLVWEENWNLTKKRNSSFIFLMEREGKISQWFTQEGRRKKMQWTMNNTRKVWWYKTIQDPVHRDRNFLLCDVPKTLSYPFHLLFFFSSVRERERGGGGKKIEENFSSSTQSELVWDRMKKKIWEERKEVVKHPLASCSWKLCIISHIEERKTEKWNKKKGFLLDI